MDCVRDIRADEIIVQCESHELQRQLELPGTIIEGVAIIPFKDRSELAKLLTWLQTLDVPFLDGGPGWTPSDVFQLMRQQDLVDGLITGVFWRGQDLPELRKI